MIQLGIVGPDEIYRMVRDSVKSAGIDPDRSRYLKEPTPGVGRARLTANDVLSIILDHAVPDGVPAEPSAEDHLDQIQAFITDEKKNYIGLFDQPQLEILQGWMTQVAQLAVAQQGQKQIAELTGDFQEKQAALAGGGNGAAPPVDQGAPPVNQNELIDETLPGNNREGS
jgi:hypothetical protein